MTFKKSEEWSMPIWHNGKQVATVQIRHWSREGYTLPNYGETSECHHWNVYALVWPEHAKFQDLLVGDSDCDAGYDMPFHGGCTFREISHNCMGAPIRVKIGCDYGHYGDERFERYTTLKDAYEVERDALELAQWLTQHA
jgi:hypothetical protein